MSTRGVAGRRGEDVRSDLWVAVEPGSEGGIELEFRSRVDFLYRASNRELVLAQLRALRVEHARVEVEDAGAVPFVIMARVEAAVRRAGLGQEGEFLPEPGPTFARPSARDRWRRSRLYLPGNEPKFMLNARLYQADGVILDLEDSVPPEDKDAALLLVRNALRAVDFGNCERMVRLNPLPRALEEIGELVRAGVNLLLIPKCEDEEEVRAVAEAVERAEREAQLGYEVYLMPIIETARGAFQAHRIAQASKRVVALTYGLEDYLADIGATRTPEGEESLWLRAQVVNAARAAGVQPIDTVYADVEDLAGLAASCRRAKALGFEGKGCIHPRQVPVVNEAFTPTAEEIARAQEIVRADRAARARGRSVAVLGSKMIDPPVVRRAQRTLELAIALGHLAPDWEQKEKEGTDGTRA